MKTYNDSFKNYRSQYYFKGLNCVDMKYQVLHYTDHETNAKFPVIHVTGVCVDDGEEIDMIMRPRQNATLKDLEALPDKSYVDGIRFRIGYLYHIDEETKEVIIDREGEPKMISYLKNGSYHMLNGKPHVWDNEAGTYERWTNEEPETEEDKEAVKEAVEEAKQDETPAEPQA